MVMMLVINMILYEQVNKTIRRMDTVYSSNVDLTDLSASLENVQQALYSYLSVKTSDSLENYYRCEQDYRYLLENLSSQISSNPTKLLERNIRQMSETYLSLTGEGVAAKRGRNVEKYKEIYDQSQELYGYINSYIYQLNSQQFRNNSSSYQALREALRYLEISSLVLMAVMMGIGALVLFAITKGMIEPLANLAEIAHLVGQGNFDVKMTKTDSLDEVGVVTRAFNTMVESLGEYVVRTKESMEKEQLTAVENYIYILNVRFAGDIHFTKKVDESIMECRVPSMILQPLVENAVNHGIRNIDWEGKILLEITGLEDNILIRVKDNGKGMSEERIREVLDGCMEDTGEQSDSTGVGMNNVISRLELYYDKKNLVEINSPGENMGTEIILTLPRTGGEK